VSRAENRKKQSILTKIFQIQIYKEHIVGFMETEESKKKVYFDVPQLKNLLTPDYNKLINELETHNLIQAEESYSCYGCNYKLFKLTEKSLNSLRSDATLQFKRVKKGLRSYCYSKYNKLTAVELSFASGNAKEIAEELDLRPELLYRWRNE